MNVLSLFSGIGGLELGLERAGMTVVGQVEIDDYRRRVLAKHWPEVPRHDDVRTCTDWWRSEPRPPVDIVCGGFPCQDISNAGRRAGIVEGTRSSLWAHMADCVRALRPRYVLVENVPALLIRGLDVVLADLAACGYDAEWDCIPAATVGARHIRDRVFIVARLDEPSSGVPDSIGVGVWIERQREWQQHQEPRPAVARHDGTPQHVADTDRIGRDRRPGVFGPRWRTQPTHSDRWAVEPDVGRVAHGVPHGMDRRRALGDAVVPQVAEHVGRLILDHAREAAA